MTVNKKQIGLLNIAAYASIPFVPCILLALYAFGIFNVANKTHLLWAGLALIAASWNAFAYKRIANKFEADES